MSEVMVDSGSRTTSQGEERNLKWLTVVLYLSDRRFYDARKIKQWTEQFADLVVAGEGEKPQSLAEDARWYRCNAKAGRSEVWNTIAADIEQSWILFLEDDEQPRFSSFPTLGGIDDNEWCPAIIRLEKEGTELQYYQMRLIYTSSQTGDIFSGFDLPDATHYVRSNDIKLKSTPLVIERESNPYAGVDIEQELAMKDQSPKLYLIQGKRDMQANNYVRASAQFRQLLKKEKLLVFDRLAAVNGLASCLAEQHKWKKTLSLVRQSLEAESLQGLPYLIRFRIHELRKEWQQAYDALRQYYDRQSLFSRANFDRLIDEEKTLVNLADMALKAGRRAKAMDYFEKLFTFKRENADRDMLEKAMLISIELGDFERSVSLFERMYSHCLPPNEMDDEYRQEIDEVMSMFMKREWYDYASNIYTELHNSYPEDGDYKRKLIVNLTKTNHLDEAKKMVANMV